MQYCLRFALLGALLASCQHEKSAVSGLEANRFQKLDPIDGFALLWQANGKRCKASQEGDRTVYRACQRFEMQVPLYNTRPRPRAVAIHIKFVCPSRGDLALHLALTPRPADVDSSASESHVRNAWFERKVGPLASEQEIRTELPADARSMLVAILNPFAPAVQVEEGCSIRYRLELAPL